MNILRYAVYVRKSTEDSEKQVLSISAQKDKILERYGDLNIVSTYEESKSAFEPYKRPILQEILDRLDKGEIDGIIAWHPDRLSRNEVDASAITWRIRQGKIKDLKFANASYENSPEGIMMLQMTMSQSQYFSSKLSKDIRRGNEKKRKIGGITGVAPAGYLNDRINKKVYKDPERFILIRKSFDLMLTGEYSVQAILKILNEDWGYRTKKRSKTGGTPLSRTTLYEIFRNVRYAGLIPDPYDSEKLYKADFPSMITEQEYDSVQALLGKHGCPRLADKKQFALRGLINCGDCGCMITAQTKKKKLANGSYSYHTYYHCTGKRVGCSQKSKYVKEDDLFNDVNNLLNSYELAPELKKWAMSALKELADVEVEERNSVQIMQNNSIVEIQNRLDRLLDMATSGLISGEEYQTKSQELKSKLNSLQDEQQSTNQRVEGWYDFIIGVFDKLTNATKEFTIRDLSYKKEILLAIGQNPVLIDGKLHITPNEWLIPVANNVTRLRQEIEKVRTMPQQMKKASEEAISLEWYTRTDSNRRPSVPKTDALIR